MSYKLEKPYTEKEKLDFIVEYNHNKNLRIEETEIALYALEAWELLQGNEVIDNTEAYEAEQEQQERERIAMLSLTRGDVFRGLLQARGVTRLMLRGMIEGNELLSDVQKEMALIDFDEALNFYRGNALIDTVGLALGIEPAQLDCFFETNDYTCLLPKEEPEEPTVSEMEIVEEPTEEE